MQRNVTEKVGCISPLVFLIILIWVSKTHLGNLPSLLIFPRINTPHPACFYAHMECWQLLLYLVGTGGERTRRIVWNKGFKGLQIPFQIFPRSSRGLNSLMCCMVWIILCVLLQLLYYYNHMFTIFGKSWSRYSQAGGANSGWDGGSGGWIANCRWTG